MLAVLGLGFVPLQSAGASPPLDLESEYFHRVWKQEHGLPDNRVYAVLETRDGYLWIATTFGLARFDGRQFTHFNPINTPEMMSDDCLALAEDVAGNLWIGTTMGALRRDPLGRFTLHRITKYQPEDAVHLLATARDGGVWAVVRNELFRLRDTGPDPGVTEVGLATDFATALLELQSGNLLVGTDADLRQVDPSKRRLVGIDNLTAKPGVAIADIHRSADGVVWVAGDGRLLSHASNQWDQVVRPRFGQPAGFSRLASDQDGTLWSTTTNGCVDRLVDGEWTRYKIPGTPENERIYCAYVDREGSLWLGTEYSGLHWIRPKKVRAYTTKDGLVHDNTWTVHETRDGSMWVGTDGGLSRLSPAGQFQNFTQADGLVRDQIRALAEDDAGTLWIGTGLGLSLFSNGQLTTHRFPGDHAANKIRVVTPSREGGVWVGTEHALHRFHAGEWRTFRTEDELSARDVRAILESRSGDVWIGTLGGGLNQFRDGRFRVWKKADGLSSDSVWALHEDDEGALWIGTAQGLNRFKDGKFTVFTTQQGLPSDLVNHILEDDRGNLWISHDRGIYRVSKRELLAVAGGKAPIAECVSFGVEDGLPSNETNGQKSQPAGWRSRGGRLWFPTTKGVVVFNPDDPPDLPQPPRPIIEQVRANGRPVMGTASPTGVDSESRLELAPGSASLLEFDYTAITFVAPDKARFKYRLEGVDTDWIDAGTRRLASYSNLSPGNYRFQVTAANHQGVWHERGHTLAIYLAPYFYQTWTFRGSSLGGVIGLSVIAYRGRLRELRKIHRLQQLAALGEERMRIARDLHDGIGANLTRINSLAEKLGEEAHALPDTVARRLADTTREMAGALRDIIWAASPAEATADGLVARICQQAEVLLNEAGIRCRFDLPDNLPAIPLTAEQRHHFLLAAKEALNNATRHAAATEVRVRARCEGSTLELVIEDNGRSFDPTSVREGNGLRNMRSRMASVGGEFQVESKVGDGTRVCLRLTIGQTATSRSDP